MLDGDLGVPKQGWKDSDLLFPMVRCVDRAARRARWRESMIRMRKFAIKTAFGIFCVVWVVFSAYLLISIGGFAYTTSKSGNLTPGITRPEVKKMLGRYAEKPLGRDSGALAWNEDTPGHSEVTSAYTYALYGRSSFEWTIFVGYDKWGKLVWVHHSES